MEIKQKQLVEIVDVPYETLRSWRRMLDPKQSRKKSVFSAMDVIAFLLIKKLIKQRFFSPKLLSRFNIEELFEWLDSVTKEEAAKMKITLRTQTRKIEIVPKERIFSDVDADLNVLLVSDAINDFEDAIWH